jgi:hypothetical protein
MASNEFGSDVRQIKVKVEEVPDAPTDVTLDYKTSRSICIRWTPAFDGNSDILEYVITVQEDKQETEQDTFSSDMTSSSSSLSPLTLLNTTISGNQSLTTSVIRNLLPSRRYILSVHARNRVGLSPASHPLTVITDEEAPGSPPSNLRLILIDATTIKVRIRSRLTLLLTSRV